MAVAKDETGNRYGRLVVIRRDLGPSKSAHARWSCKCDCGSVTTVLGANLRRGLTSSCGCLKLERISQANTTHGRSGSSELNIFMGLNQRCLNENSKDFERYGGRGIAVCDRWHRGTPNAFENFLDDMGERPSPKHSIDRVDNDGPYSPENCRWATVEEQQNNRRNNHLLTYAGRTQTVTQWARELGVNRNIIYLRIRSGATTEEALQQ